VPDPASILIIRPSALGDVCRTVPVLASLRGRYPGARIDWLVQAEFAPAIDAHPDLSAAIPFHRTEMTRAKLWRPGGLRRLHELHRRLRGPGYDLVLDCQGLLRSGLFAWWTRAPRRLTYADAAESASRFATERVDAPRSLHTVDRMLRLAEAAGAEPVRDLRLYPPPADHPALDLPPSIVVAPTSRWPGKRWPDDRFVEVARALLEHDPAARLVVVGGASERDQCPRLLDLADREPRILDLVARTSIPALMRLIKTAPLVLANDSAALHLAVGLDRPLVALFGPTRIQLVGPYGRDRDVIQPDPPSEGITYKDQRAGEALMAHITTESVIRACLERLQPSPATSAPPHPRPVP
jgi:heptosyltransferase-1